MARVCRSVTWSEGFCTYVTHTHSPSWCRLMIFTVLPLLRSDPCRNLLKRHLSGGIFRCPSASSRSSQDAAQLCRRYRKCSGNRIAVKWSCCPARINTVSGQTTLMQQICLLAERAAVGVLLSSSSQVSCAKNSDSCGVVVFSGL